MMKYEGYIENCTNNWKMICEQEDYSLWSYWDGVEWCGGFAIKYDDTIKSLLEVEYEYQAKEIFDVVIECVKENE